MGRIPHGAACGDTGRYRHGHLRRSRPPAHHQLLLRHERLTSTSRAHLRRPAGRVVEIGFGTGHNIGCYPDAVKTVTAIEPSDTSWRLSTKRREGSSVPIERGGLDGQSLPYPDASFDTALSTWTLCTIPDAIAALQEVRRVLVPGGTLHFVEHGLAPDATVRRTQHRLEPLQKRMFGGCHLTRQIPELITAAGFSIAELDQFYEERVPKVFGAASLGIAAA